MAYRGKTNNRSDQRYTNQFADDRFHSRKAKRLPQTQKWQQYSPQRAVAQSATGRIRGGELGRTVTAATGRLWNTMFHREFFFERSNFSALSGVAISLQLVNSLRRNRAVAQLGSALEWGAYPDDFSNYPDLI